MESILFVNCLPTVIILMTIFCSPLFIKNNLKETSLSSGIFALLAIVSGIWFYIDSYEHFAHKENLNYLSLVLFAFFYWIVYTSIIHFDKKFRVLVTIYSVKYDGNIIVYKKIYTIYIPLATILSGSTRHYITDKYYIISDFKIKFGNRAETINMKSHGVTKVDKMNSRYTDTKISYTKKNINYDK